MKRKTTKILLRCLLILIILQPLQLLFNDKYFNLVHHDFEAHVNLTKIRHFDSKNHVTKIPNYRGLYHFTISKLSDGINDVHTTMKLFQIFLVVCFRLLLVIFLLKYSTSLKKTFFIMLFFVLTYFIPPPFSWNLNHEIYMLNAGTTPSFLGITFALASLVFPLSSLFFLILTYFTTNSGFAIFFLIMSIPFFRRKIFKKPLVLAFTILSIYFLFNFEKMINFIKIPIKVYIFSPAFLYDNRFSGVIIIFLILLFSNREKSKSEYSY